MKLGILFSGGKDSTYVAWLASKTGYELACLITIESKNKDSFMFHTPSINQTRKQTEVMGIPLLAWKTKGNKEEELKDLENAIKLAIKRYKIEGIVTGAVESVYQASRIQKICKKLKIECFNPLWQKNQIELISEIIENKFEAIVVSVAAYPLDSSWIGRKIDSKFISGIENLSEKYKINPAGEGGEFESFVLNCPLFSRGLRLKNKKISGSGNSWRAEIEIE